MTELSLSYLFNVDEDFYRKYCPRLLTPHFDIKEDYAESQMLSTLIIESKNEIKRLQPHIDSVKQSYKKKILDLTKQDLDLVEFDTKKTKIQNYLDARLRLRFCLNNLFDDEFCNYSSPFIAIDLFIIFKKLYKVFYKNKPNSLKLFDIRFCKLERYFEDLSKNYNIIQKQNLHSLTKDLFINMIKERTYKQNADYEPILLADTSKNYFMEYVGIDLDDDETQELNKMEQKYQDWLVDEMHIIKKGKTF